MVFYFFLVKYIPTTRGPSKMYETLPTELFSNNFEMKQILSTEFFLEAEDEKLCQYRLVSVKEKVTISTVVAHTTMDISCLVFIFDFLI